MLLFLCGFFLKANYKHCDTPLNANDSLLSTTLSVLSSLATSLGISLMQQLGGSASPS